MSMFPRGPRARFANEARQDVPVGRTRGPEDVGRVRRSLATTESQLGQWPNRRKHVGHACRTGKEGAPGDSRYQCVYITLSGPSSVSLARIYLFASIAEKAGENRLRHDSGPPKNRNPAAGPKRGVNGPPVRALVATDPPPPTATRLHHGPRHATRPDQGRRNNRWTRGPPAALTPEPVPLTSIPHSYNSVTPGS
ncbi:hypothetical protein MRX96_001988 [Rhipicephalus microplus]